MAFKKSRLGKPVADTGGLHLHNHTNKGKAGDEVVNFQNKNSKLLPPTDSVRQALVEVVDRARRHLANGELSGIFFKRFLKLSLGQYRSIHFAVHLYQLLFERLRAGINSSTKRLFGNTSETRQLVVGIGDACTNGRSKILHIIWSNSEQCRYSSGCGSHSQVVVLQNHLQLVG